MSDRWNIIHLGQRALRLTLLPGIGGRLWGVEFQGRELLFQNPDLMGLSVDDQKLSDLPTRSPQFAFPLWGGEKAWIAPDTAWLDGAPFPVLDSGAYRVTSADDTHVEMTSAVCPLSRLSVTRHIKLTSDATWTIQHSVTNHETQPVPTGIWSVMMLRTPCAIGVAADAPSIHPVFGTSEGLVAQQHSGVVANCSHTQEFKIGLPNPDGTTLIRCGQGGPWLICSVLPPKPDDRFAHGHPVEVFNSGDYDYCEAEWHSPYHTLASHETLEFEQQFRVSASGSFGTPNQEELARCMS